MSRIPHLPKLLLIMVLLAPAVSLVAPSTVSPAGAQEPLEFVFEGSGWGHGLGMSQYGAQNMALQGFSASEIISHYYGDKSPDDNDRTTIETREMPQIGGTATTTAPLRVLLADRRSETFLQSTGPISVRYQESNGVSSDISIPDGTTSISVDAIGHSLKLNVDSEFYADYDGSGGASLLVSFPEPIVIDGVDGSEPGTYLWGKIELSIALDAGDEVHDVLRIIESNLSMANYLKGIAEMPSSWEPAALEAQAIAARSYALAKRIERSGGAQNFDLYDSTWDQHYIGYAQHDQVRWVDAVTNTASEVAINNGTPIAAYYSSSSGGHTENSEYVWAATLPYIRGIDDPYDLWAANPNASWTRTYSQETVSQWMSGYGVGTVLSMTFEGNFGVSGRVDRAKLVVVGTGGDAVITGGQLFRRFNTAAFGDTKTYGLVLPSTLFTINGSGAGAPTPTPPPVVHIPSGSSNTYSQAALDPLEPGPGEVRVRGWSFDPDLPTFPQVVHVYAFYDGSDTPVALDTPVVLAASPRPDVNRALNVGGNHGFNRRLAIRPGTHKVCVYSISVDGTGATDDLNRLIGCRTVTISAEALPTGTYDSISRTGNEVTVTGWAYDLDKPSASVDIQVYLDGSFSHRISAAVPRTDLNRILDVTGNHGFVDTFTVTDGWHDVCLYVVGIDPGGLPDGQTTALGCK